MTDQERADILTFCRIPLLNVKDVVEVEKTTGSCKICQRDYRYPATVFKPRDLICNTCEAQIREVIARGGNPIF